MYTSSAALAAQLGREHFDRAAEDPWLDACKEADLLILDDLGTGTWRHSGVVHIG